MYKEASVLLEYVQSQLDDSNSINRDYYFALMITKMGLTAVMKFW